MNLLRLSISTLILLAAATAPAAEQQRSSNTNSGPEYSTFRIVNERNIFNPRRYSRSARAPQQPASRVDSFTLVGTMSYEKGDLAFFEGSSSDLRKVAKVSDNIAGYKITNISYNAVKLASDTNALQKEIQLGVGMQMRREDNGPWHLASGSEIYTSTNSVSGAVASTSSSDQGSDTTTPTTSSNSDSSSADDPVLKRLMQRREQENNR